MDPTSLYMEAVAYRTSANFVVLYIRAVSSFPSIMGRVVVYTETGLPGCSGHGFPIRKPKERNVDESIPKFDYP